MPECSVPRPPGYKSALSVERAQISRCRGSCSHRSVSRSPGGWAAFPFTKRPHPPPRTLARFHVSCSWAVLMLAAKIPGFLRSSQRLWRYVSDVRRGIDGLFIVLQLAVVPRSVAPSPSPWLRFPHLPLACLYPSHSFRRTVRKILRSDSRKPTDRSTNQE